MLAIFFFWSLSYLQMSFKLQVLGIEEMRGKNWGKRMLPGASWWGNSQWNLEGSVDQGIPHWSWLLRQWSPWAPLSSNRYDCVFLANVAWLQNTCHIAVGNRKRWFVSNGPFWAESRVRYLDSTFRVWVLSASICFLEIQGILILASWGCGEYYAR